ncbi:hypothetical protein Csa_003337 [Cucumis sativus]|uniref:Uncharacterized protein n=1 Tax=Cucumis sativus TaxID=3659 RepID=A0A0A0KLB8_CUCSA|nr:hypothetical protein Csa_003337 [Cucumis sativus]
MDLVIEAMEVYWLDVLVVGLSLSILDIIISSLFEAISDPISGAKKGREFVFGNDVIIKA